MKLNDIYLGLTGQRTLRLRLSDLGTNKPSYLRTLEFELLDLLLRHPKKVRTHQRGEAISGYCHT